MQNYSKKIKRQLRELAATAYERELDAQLRELEKQFSKWKNSEISTWKLNDFIHQHHDYDARELYKFYMLNNYYTQQVTLALENNILKKEEIPEDILSMLILT